MSWNYRDVPPEYFGKVTYLRKDGGRTQAYVDMRSMEGQNKHTDEYVKLVWSEWSDSYVEA